MLLVTLVGLYGWHATSIRVDTSVSTKDPQPAYTLVTSAAFLSGTGERW